MLVVICLMNFRAYLNILLIIKVKVLVLIKRSYRFLLSLSPNLLMIEFKMVRMFRTRRQSLFWCLFLDPYLTTYHSIIAI
jgi:hypothetical protein